jgi:hypothetical protein
MQVSIISDAENFSFEVVKSNTPPTQDSFRELELFKRIAYNRKFITEILDHHQGYHETTKQKALNHAYWQHKISGNNNQYPKTFDAQKIYMNEIFREGSSLNERDKKIKQDVNGYLNGVNIDPKTLYFPDPEVTRVYHQDEGTRKEAYHQDERRRRKIETDFDAVRTTKQLLELIDAYRQFAINDIVQGGGTFDQKKKKIENIFTTTAFVFNVRDNSITLKKDKNVVTTEQLKDSLKKLIIADPTFAVDPSKPPKEASLTDIELLKKIIYNKHLISGTLNLQVHELPKHKALNSVLVYIAKNQNENELKKILEKKDNTRIEQIAESDAMSFYLKANSLSFPSKQKPALTIIPAGMDPAFTEQSTAKPPASPAPRTMPAFSVDLRRSASNSLASKDKKVSARSLFAGPRIGL